MSDFNIDKFIDYCKSTKQEQWCEDVVRSKDGNANCLFGHLFEFAGDDKKGNEYWDYFEYHYATTYMVYPVNDGKNADYQQESAKERCIAYLENLKSGKEKTTEILMEECYQHYLKENNLKSNDSKDNI